MNASLTTDFVLHFIGMTSLTNDMVALVPRITFHILVNKQLWTMRKERRKQKHFNFVKNTKQMKRQ